MAQISLKDQIVYQLDRLTPEQQRRVLEFTTSLIRPRGTPGHVLLKYAGSIPPDDLDRMEQAIEDCESIDPDEWL